jgi:hypothetical protein
MVSERKAKVGEATHKRRSAKNKGTDKISDEKPKSPFETHGQNKKLAARTAGADDSVGGKKEKQRCAAVDKGRERQRKGHSTRGD